MIVSSMDIRETIKKMDLFGKPVCLHSSLSSFGWFSEGAVSLIDEFLLAGCTVLVPTFCYHFEVSQPTWINVKRNGFGVAGLSHQFAVQTGYTTDSLEIDPDMGIVPKVVLGMPERVRGYHPLNSFTAVGPLAGTLVCDQTPTNVYSPLAKLASVGGVVVLAGVQLNRMTLLHFAEQLAGRRLFCRWARVANNSIVETVETNVGGCSEGFPNLDDVLVPRSLEYPLGDSFLRVFPAQETLTLASQVIYESPAVTHCQDENCVRCNDMIEGGPIF